VTIIHLEISIANTLPNQKIDLLTVTIKQLEGYLATGTLTSKDLVQQYLVSEPTLRLHPLITDWLTS
jgi:hypothetical protein